MFVSNDIYEELTDEDGQLDPSVKIVQVVNCKQLYVRAKPSKDSEIVSTVKKDDFLLCKSCEHGWSSVVVDVDIQGFVMTEFTEVVEPYVNSNDD